MLIYARELQERDSRNLVDGATKLVQSPDRFFIRKKTGVSKEAWTVDCWIWKGY